MESAAINFLDARLHAFGLGESFLNGANHVKRLLRNIVVLAFNDFAEAAHCVFNLDVLPFEAGELRSDEHRLGEELFDFPGASDGALVVVGKFFDAENGDDVLQVFVALQNGFDGAGNGVMLGANDAWIENARVAGKWIDCGVDATFSDL